MTVMNRDLHKINVKEHHKKELISLINKYLPNTKIWVYGSRIKSTCRPSSDLDMVAFIKKEKYTAFYDLIEALDESSLPFKVDLFIWDKLPEEFRKNIETEYVILSNNQ